MGIQHATRAIGDWISSYNTRRPQQALDMNTPAEAFACKRCVVPVVSARDHFGHAALQLSLQEFGSGTALMM